jgi:hypothetical protein
MRAAPAIAEGFARGSGVRTNIRHSAAPKFQAHLRRFQWARRRTWIIRMSPQPESSTQEVLAGLVERITYYNAENGFVFCAPGRAGIVMS